mgnify:CR=1 FL=1
MADEQTVITRGEGGAPKGPQNAKERVYEKLRFIPIRLLDAILVVLGVAVVVCLIVGAVKGNQ